MATVRVSSEQAIVAVCDASVTLPSGANQAALVRELDVLATRGQVFYLITDDPVTYTIELLADGESLRSGAHELEAAGGSFGLDVPSGSIAVAGWRADGAPAVAGTMSVAPGTHVLSAQARRPFDGPRYSAHMAAALGADWTYMQRVNKLGLVGCLPLLITGVALVAQQRRLLWYVAPLLAVSWLPYLVLRRMRRYREAERRLQAESDSWPDFVLSVARSEQPTLPGGFLRV